MTTGLAKLGGTISQAQRITVGAIVGGTSSEISGGKFANGAITGAFAAALREGANTVKNTKYDATTNKFIDSNVTHYDGAGH